MDKQKSILNLKDYDTIKVEQDLKPEDVMIIGKNGMVKQGSVFGTYKKIGENIEINNQIIEKKDYVFLNENLTPQQEKKVKELISKEIGRFLWNLYTKRAIFT